MTGAADVTGRGATSVFALATRGLEAVAAAEIAGVAGARIVETAYRRVSATCADTRPLLGLRCVDDLFLSVASWSGIGRPRSVLADLSKLAGSLDLHQAQRARGGIVAGPPSPTRRTTFSVTPSFVGKRNYGNDEIKAAIAAAITASHGWDYRERDDQSELNLRVFIEHELAYLGVRLAARPLHERAYKRAHAPGSLRPSIAAAMVALSRVGSRAGSRHVLVDPCCGAGTIVIEAGAVGAVARGGDSDPIALAAALENTAAAGAGAPARWDARALPLPDRSVDRVVCNLPWGLQVSSGADIADLHGRICAEARRVLAPAGVVTVLTHAPDLLAFPGLACEQRIEISVSGQTPVIATYA